MSNIFGKDVYRIQDFFMIKNYESEIIITLFS